MTINTGKHERRNKTSEHTQAKFIVLIRYLYIITGSACLKAVTDIRLTLLHFKFVGQLPNYIKREVSSIVFDKLRRENVANFSRMTAVNHCFTPSSGAIQGPTKRL